MDSPAGIVLELTRDSGWCKFRVKEGLKIRSLLILLEYDLPSNPSVGVTSGSAVPSVRDEECWLSVLKLPLHP